MTQLPPWRLNLLRICYVLLVFFLGSTIWPRILDSGLRWELMRGVVTAMLGALSLLSVLGLRHPLRMLPLLFFELAWKAIWLLRVALPLWSAGTLDAATAATATECLLIIGFIFLIPWDHVWRRYIASPGEPWRRKPAA